MRSTPSFSFSLLGEGGSRSETDEGTLQNSAQAVAGAVTRLTPTAPSVPSPLSARPIATLPGAQSLVCPIWGIVSGSSGTSAWRSRARRTVGGGAVKP